MTEWLIAKIQQTQQRKQQRENNKKHVGLKTCGMTVFGEVDFCDIFHDLQSTKVLFQLLSKILLNTKVQLTLRVEKNIKKVSRRNLKDINIAQHKVLKVLLNLDSTQLHDDDDAQTFFSNRYFQ